MTCEECQPLVIDLARGLPPFGVGEAVQRGDVLSHIARCKRCAEWLATQEALTEALRAAAEADAALSAPPGVEAHVMAAWRARQAKRQLPVPTLGMLDVLDGSSSEDSRIAGTPAPSSEVPERRWKPAGLAWPARFPTLAGFAAAAAVVIFVLSLVSLRSLNTPPGTGESTPADASAGAAAPAGASTAPSASSAPSAPSTPSDRSDPSAIGGSTRAPVTGTNAAIVEVLPEKGSKGSKGRPAPPRGVVRPVAVARGFDAARGVGSRRGATSGRGANELAGPAFVLLPYVEPLRPTEMRHIMRVRMSRALVVAGDVQAGNVDGGTVLADVLVGEDGMARAVRIVQ